ncbi:MAG: DEAD/DEAH box helicase [Oscillospiraceae bacterium]|nr:DEAD/DEAH box helicase [Oscillospiraceae bacterium]
MKSIVFIDTEVNPEKSKVLDYGGVKPDHSKLHSASAGDFVRFISGAEYICGHNLIEHDLRYIGDLVNTTDISYAVDTLYLSPLLFPDKLFHSLSKDDKISDEELSNPYNDAVKAMDLFFEEVSTFSDLQLAVRDIYCQLLYDKKEFYGFFKFMNCSSSGADLKKLIGQVFYGLICENADLNSLIKMYPTELAYCLSQVSTENKSTVMPHWVLKKYPAVSYVMRCLRAVPCHQSCRYCNEKLDVGVRLKDIFGYDSFRIYNGEPLQKRACESAVNNNSLLAVFPTGGGKSLTFQLPAIMAGESYGALTVVISPLQSLMKDQVDNLCSLGIYDAVTINGLLSPLERADAIEAIADGRASLLYISPESLRSKTIEKLLLSRSIARFVIDEAHCFSAWGQDFRVDYLYIADFITELMKKKDLSFTIPVSCFTATAKQKVISDIREYFKLKLGLDLSLFATGSARTNLRYEVLHQETADEKYITMRNLIESKNCPTIVYASRTKKTLELALKLKNDGFNAAAFNGKMDPQTKISNQDAFIRGDIQIIVAITYFLII